MQQLGDDREHADEVSGAGRSLERVCHRSGMNPHERLRRIHRILAWNEQAIDPAFSCELAIPLHVSGIGREIFSRPELKGVDEDAQHHAVDDLPGAVDQT